MWVNSNVIKLYPQFTCICHKGVSNPLVAYYRNGFICVITTTKHDFNQTSQNISVAAASNVKNNTIPMFLNDCWDVPQIKSLTSGSGIQERQTYLLNFPATRISTGLSLCTCQSLPACRRGNISLGADKCWHFLSLKILYYSKLEVHH
jgi:hypothetical protein